MELTRKRASARFLSRMLGRERGEKEGEGEAGTAINRARIFTIAAAGRNARIGAARNFLGRAVRCSIYVETVEPLPANSLRKPDSPLADPAVRITLRGKYREYDARHAIPGAGQSERPMGIVGLLEGTCDF